MTAEPETPGRFFQDEIFVTGEADAWYARNAAALVSGEHDAVLKVVREFDRREEIGSVCDLGCSNGWRLAALAAVLPRVTRLAGTDPSVAAIEAGRRRWPELQLDVGTLAHNGLSGQFDLTIVSGVFCWVDRASLARSVARVDELVAPDGVLVIGDFMAEEPYKVPYHHRSDVAVFTHKQDHAALFRALGTYRETFRIEYDHDLGRLTSLVPTRMTERRNRWFLSVLVKKPD